jgi:hypothetical protein
MRAEIWVHRDDLERAKMALEAHRKAAAEAQQSEGDSSTAIRPGPPE